jgi:hypothetical protein
MTVARSRSVSRPALEVDDAAEVLATLRMLDAMGLLPLASPLQRLDMAALRRAVRAASAAGIGRDAAALLHGGAGDPATVRRVVAQLREALEDSPVPQSEIRELLGIFDPDALGALVGASASSLRRYALGARATPDDVAARIHWLAKVVGHLRGAYNDAGVKRWFERRRVQLDDRPPRALLLGAWDPEDDGPRAVRGLARALSGGGAT